jgi:PIN domain nuclease of toxin-antitoxin system
MKYLLDTHAFLWFITANPMLGRNAERAIRDPSNLTILSIATPWEIAIKVGLGKLILGEPFGVYITREITNNSFPILTITLDHLAIVATLAHYHRDPFDRLLIAQAIAEGMPILSADPAFDAYGVTRLW